MSIKSLQINNYKAILNNHNKIKFGESVYVGDKNLYISALEDDNGKGKVLINGVLAPTVGNICMDMSMIDVSAVSSKIGDKVEVFGKNRKIEELANEMSSIPYEVLSSISERVVRIYTED